MLWKDNQRYALIKKNWITIKPDCHLVTHYTFNTGSHAIEQGNIHICLNYIPVDFNKPLYTWHSDIYG